MHQPSLSCLVALLFSTTALADFSVYTNRQIDQIPGSGAMQNGMKIEATREVSCDDFCAGNAIYSFHNDATRNAYACKGCSAGKNSRDWEIEQFEFNNDVATVSLCNNQSIISKHLGKRENQNCRMWMLTGLN